MASTHAHSHILPLRVYFLVAAALFVLTGVTVAISFVHFGVFNLLVAMLVAVVKASLVILFFMHLKYDNKLYLTIFLTAVVFLGVFIVLTMADTMTRGDIDPAVKNPIRQEAVIYDDHGRPLKAGHGEAEHEGAAGTDSTAAVSGDEASAHGE